MLRVSPLVMSGWLARSPTPSKCVLLSTSRMVRKGMKDWVLSQEKIDGLSSLMSGIWGGSLGWSSTFAARVRLVISRLVLIFALPLDFHGRIRVVRSMYLPAALMGLRPLCLLLTAFGSFCLLSTGLCGLVVNLWLVLVLS